MNSILNAENLVRGKIKDMDKLGVKALDDYTFQVTLERPTPYFPSEIPSRLFYPLHEKSVRELGNQWTRAGNMISNGPYKFVAWKPQGSIKLVKNEYFREAGQVQIDTVIHLPTEDSSAEVKQFRAGEIDITATIALQNFEWVMANLKDDVHISPQLATYYYPFNMRLKKFQDLRVRRALALALNREIITDKVSRAGEIPAYSWVPPGMLGYESPQMVGAGQDHASRFAEAQRLMREAGYSPDKPLEIELLYNTNQGHKKMAVAAASMWKRLGVKVSLRNEEWKVYLNSTTSGDFEVSRAGWVAGIDDACPVLKYFHSVAGDMNYGGYESAEFDAYLDQAGEELDLSRRAALMAEAEMLLMRDLPLLPVYFYTVRSLVKPYVKGWVENPIAKTRSRWLSIDKGPPLLTGKQ